MPSALNHEVGNPNLVEMQADSVCWSSQVVLDLFARVRDRTDDMIRETGFEGYAERVHPAQAALATSLFLDALAKLRCDIRGAKPGQRLRAVTARTTNAAMHKHLGVCWAHLADAGIVTQEAEGIYSRSTLPVVAEASPRELLKDMALRFPGFESLGNLTFHVGSHLAEMYAGRMDSVKVLFGSSEGSRLLEDIYGSHHPSKTFHRLMEEFLSLLLDHIGSAQRNTPCAHPTSSLGQQQQQPLKILELGAGTGGTTKWLAPLLERKRQVYASLSCLYTFTDVGPGFLVQAARKFAQYSDFMAFTTQDIEELPPPASSTSELELGERSQDVVVAVNAIHATANLVRSLSNVRRFLRPGGIALLSEIEEPLFCTDFIFGTFDGWWLPEDGRTRATTDSATWEKAFREAGFEHVDWTRGALPDARVQRIYLATVPR